MLHAHAVVFPCGTSVAPVGGTRQATESRQASWPEQMLIRTQVLASPLCMQLMLCSAGNWICICSLQTARVSPCTCSVSARLAAASKQAPERLQPQTRVPEAAGGHLSGRRGPPRAHNPSAGPSLHPPEPEAQSVLAAGTQTWSRGALTGTQT